MRNCSAVLTESLFSTKQAKSMNTRARSSHAVVVFMRASHHLMFCGTTHQTQVGIARLKLTMIARVIIQTVKLQAKE